ncbi:hypothetical protein V8D89_000250 [Ganoderma adspersum]
MTGDKSDIPWSTTLSFSSWAQDTLHPGYTISKSDLRPTGDLYLQHDNSSCLFLRLSNDDNSVNLLIQYHHMRTKLSYSRKVGGFGAVIEAHTWILSPDSILDGSPPYASTIWGSDVRHSTLPTRDMHVITHSGDEMTLRLWLGMAEYGHYHAYIEVATDSAHPTHALSTRYDAFQGILDPPHITELHTDLKFTMIGSVRRALEAQEYSVDLEHLGKISSNSHSLSLTVSNVDSGLTITIKYFYALYTGHDSTSQQLIVVAHVTSESSLNPSHGSERYQDGPYVQRYNDLCIPDSFGWNWDGHAKDIYITTPTGNLLVLTLGLEVAWVSEYYLVVGIRHADRYRFGPNDDSADGTLFRMIDPHDRIILTLPGHIKRALQAHGYEVHFQGPDEDHSDPYHLTLSNTNLIIDIVYSHHLSTLAGPGSNSPQELTFQARVTTSVLRSSQDAATHPRGQIVDWDTWQPETRYELGYVGERAGWRWILPQKNVKLELPNGLTLTLGLSLYLVWLSEYCITVEVIPPTPFPPIPSPKALRPYLSFKQRLTKFLDLLTPACIRHRRKHIGNDRRGGAGDNEERSTVPVVALVTSPGLDEGDAEAKRADVASSNQDESGDADLRRGDFVFDSYLRLSMATVMMLTSIVAIPILCISYEVLRVMILRYVQCSTLCLSSEADDR